MSHVVSAEKTFLVLLVHGRPVMREGVRSVIEQEPDLVMVGQAATMRDASRLDVAPDVIVTEVDLPDAQHSVVIVGLRASFEHTPILVFSAIIDPVAVQSVLAAGADGYLPDTAGTAELRGGIRSVAAGETYLPPQLVAMLAPSRRVSDTTGGLSPQERRVLRLLVLGHTNEEIARLCNISLRTAQTHRAHIQRKLDRRTRAELVEYAQQIGIAPFGPL